MTSTNDEAVLQVTSVDIDNIGEMEAVLGAIDGAKPNENKAAESTSREETTIPGRENTTATPVVFDTELPPAAARALSDFTGEDGRLDLAALKKAGTHRRNSKMMGRHMSFGEFPPDVRAHLSAFDLDGDGVIDKEELKKAADLWKKSRTRARRLACIVGILSFKVCLILALMTLLMWVVVENTKESKVTNTVLTVPGSTDPVATGRMKAELPLGILPRMPEEFLDNLKYINVETPTGDRVSAQLSRTRVTNQTYMMLHTTSGDIIRIESPVLAAVQLADEDYPYDLCAACSHCGSYDVLVDAKIQSIIDSFWQDVDTIQDTDGLPAQCGLSSATERARLLREGRELGEAQEGESTDVEVPLCDFGDDVPDDLRSACLERDDCLWHPADEACHVDGYNGRTCKNTPDFCVGQQCKADGFCWSEDSCRCVENLNRRMSNRGAPGFGGERRQSGARSRGGSSRWCQAGQPTGRNFGQQGGQFGQPGGQGQPFGGQMR